MRTRSSSSQLLLALSCTALLVSACGGDTRSSGTKPRGSNNNTSNNNNTNNNSATDCSANPLNCAPNELIGAAPGCSCLNVCATGFTWNPASLTCDTVGSPPDAGTPPADAGTNNNNNNPPDAGMPPVGGCQTASECPDSGDLCVNQMTLATCAGETDCACVTQCQPNQASTGCLAGEACYWTNGTALEGVCVQDQGGQAHGQSCNAMFDPAGGLTGDNCAVNHYCWGASATEPTGTCGRLCPPNNNVVCPALGNYTCDTSVSADGSIGLCFEPAPASSDDGASCMSGADCTVSGRCVTELGGLCAETCGGLARCEAASVCIPFQAPIGEACVLDCTMGDNALCEGRNAATACHRFDDGMGGTFGLCFPKCMDDMTCLQQGQTCNVATGACS